MNKKASAATYVEHQGRIHLFPLIPTKRKMPVEIRAPKLPADTRTVSELLENIQAVFPFSVPQLANFFGASRQEYYAWLKKYSTPQPETIDLIENLGKIAKSFARAGILHYKAEVFLNIKNSEGKTLLDLVKAKEPYQSHLKELIAEAKIQKEAYDHSGIAQSTTERTSDWLCTFIPAYRETLE